ncbi:hypothetical protein [Devosia nitrariae]|uniref:Invasion associated locus B family protein n=1 Tax=Devosia nitrariae TaxID=2071872 RepID=A0ABQ5W3B2_9HYPH|nr:hypothetical protein [Devosia nitrariae]GLQ54462.1 hypothetical protein GCM10010862_17210 [Devosia nitrariae]
MLLALVPAAPVHAQPAPIWGGYYNMGTFAAGGGSEAGGSISLECAGPDLADAGAFLLELTPAARIEPFADAPPQLDFSIDGKIMTVPVTAENGAVFFYRSEPEGDVLALELIAGLRRGNRLVVSAPELDIVDIPLRGSSQALLHVAECVAGED